MTLEANRIYCGDCLDIMTDIDDCSIDMILADLPYGTTNCEWDSIIPFEPLWAHYKRIIKPRGPIVLTASQPFTTCLINAAGLDWFKYEWIWEKTRITGFLNSNRRPLGAHESILVFSDGEPLYNPQIIRGMKHKRNRNKSNNQQTDVYSEFRGMGQTFTDQYYPRSIIKFSQDRNVTVTRKHRPNKEKRHPNQKPVALFAYLIRTYSNPGDLVMDNAAGSGTTAIAAIETGRNWICIEKDAGYCQVAQERVDKRLAQPFLPTIVEHGSIDHEQAQLPLDNSGEMW